MLEDDIDRMRSKLSKKQEEKLRKLQKRIAKKVILKDKFSKLIKTIAGFDLAFSNDNSIATGVVLDYKSLHVKEIKSLIINLSFPYVPTFLTFREGPPIIKVYKKLKIKPDVMMINGQGICHPLFCGIASHIGVLLNVPSIGVAQSRLVGKCREPIKVGTYSSIKYQNKKVGYAYKSKENCKPILISPGHRISTGTSLKITKKCIKNHKLPEPILIAHKISNKIINTENK
jgi:deoxyribonuclease V